MGIHIFFHGCLMLTLSSRNSSGVFQTHSMIHTRETREFVIYACNNALKLTEATSLEVYMN